LNNLFTRYLIPTAALLTIASQTAAQNSETLEQGLSNSGTSVSNLLHNARYDFGRGLTFTSQDGASSATVSGQVQAGYSWTESNIYEDTITGELFADADYSAISEFSSDARIRLGGSVMDGKASFFVQMNPSGGGQGNDNLVDAWVGWGLADSINLRLGQQKMRSGLSADTSANDTDFETVTRSIATSAFANARATGALLEGKAMDDRFNWHFGVANSSTAGADLDDQGNDDTDMMVTVGASFGSHAGNSESWSEGDLALTGDMQWIAGATVTANNQVDGDSTQTVNVFGGFKSGNGLAAQFDYWTRDNDFAESDNNTPTGYSVQASYTLAKMGSMQPGFVLRHSSIDFDLDPAVDDVTETALGVNAYYAEHNLKTQLQVTSRAFGDGAFGDSLETTSLDLLFTLVF